jgi:hypothetical protein
MMRVQQLSDPRYAGLGGPLCGAGEHTSHFGIRNDPFKENLNQAEIK